MTQKRQYNRWTSGQLDQLVDLVYQQQTIMGRRISWIDIGKQMNKTARQCYDLWVQKGKQYVPNRFNIMETQTLTCQQSEQYEFDSFVLDSFFG